MNFIFLFLFSSPLLSPRPAAHQNICAYTISDRESMPIKVNVNSEEARHITLDQFAYLLDNKSLNDWMFPNGIYSVYSWFFDGGLTSNIKFLEKLHAHVVITKPLFRHLTQSQSSSIGEGNHAEREFSGLIGLSSHHFCSGYLLYHIDIFGTPTKGREEENYAHLLRNFLYHAIQVFDTRMEIKKLNILGSRIEGIPQEWIGKTLTSYGFTFNEDLSQYQDQYYFEQKFIKSN